MAIGPNAKPKAPKYPLGQPGSPGTRFAPSSRKAPQATGMDPTDPNYGTMTSGSGGDLQGKGAKISGVTGRDIPSGQGNLQSKARRSF